MKKVFWIHGFLLLAIVAADPDRYLREDKLHLSEAGITTCAAAVARAVSPWL